MSATGSSSSPGKPGGGLPPPQRLQIKFGLVLDARRAVFIPEASVLAVADLHLGYAWAQRSRGMLLPVQTPDSTAGRLAALVRDHAPATVAILGDIIHRAVALPALRASLEDLCHPLEGTRIVLCPGNHDRHIEGLIADWKLPVTVVPELRLGGFRLCHGDDPPAGDRTRSGATNLTLEGDALVSMIGHEHPAIELGDGIATRVRVPCFLESEGVFILPAFSDWVAGCVLGRDPFLGSIARSARFHTAYACLGPRLLAMPIPLRGGGR